MSPEQANGRADLIGPRTDVFGLGGLLYHLLTGRALYVGSSPRIRFSARAGGRLRPGPPTQPAGAALAGADLPQGAGGRSGTAIRHGP